MIDLLIETGFFSDTELLDLYQQTDVEGDAAEKLLVEICRRDLVCGQDVIDRRYAVTIH